MAALEREQVGLGGDVVDGVDDLGDLERAVTEVLDLLGDALHLTPDPLHAVEASLHRLLTLLGGVEALPGGAGGVLGGCRPRGGPRC